MSRKERDQVMSIGAMIEEPKDREAEEMVSARLPVPGAVAFGLQSGFRG